MPLPGCVCFAQKFKCFAPCYMWLPYTNNLCLLSFCQLCHPQTYSHLKSQEAEYQKREKTQPHKQNPKRAGQCCLLEQLPRALLLFPGKVLHSPCSSRGCSSACASNPSSLQSCIGSWAGKLKQQCAPGEWKRNGDIKD